MAEFLNILIVANHYAVCSARYAADAFARLGHTVHSQHPDAVNSDGLGRSIWGLQLPEHYTWQPTQPMNQYICRGDWDLVVFMDSDPKALDYALMFNDPDYAHIHTTRRTVVWGVDNHVRDYRRDWFEHYFLAHHSPSLMPYTTGRWYNNKSPKNVGESVLGMEMYLNMTYLPCAYDPQWHTPSPIPWQERQYDVAVLGMMYPQRIAAVKELQAAGLKVAWGCGAVYETYRDLHHQSRIALNLSFNGDVGQRVFETAAMGCLVMSDPCPDYELLKPNGFWLLEEGKSITEQVQTVLAQPDVANDMVARSLAWVNAHTWDNRAKRIVGWYE